MKVDKNLFVEAQYKLYAQTKGVEGEELVEETTSEVPFQYIHGLGMMLPAFEQKLLGLEAGEKFDFVLSCTDAYGERSDEYIANLPKEIFMVEDEFDSEMVFAGAQVPLMDAEGNQLIGTVVEVADEHVRVDLNHPLAGNDLHFIGEVTDVHEATTEEIEMFFPQEGGCCSSGGCSSGGCSSGGCGCC
ncbi:MAG: FKBP-type peptidyl-prolyl cis-trans isomerase [Porphyromonas sp.]|nr:FKBP-type peptidyl-prolyl cis-trans isomerase [Porphyromonas sp.]